MGSLRCVLIVEDDPTVLMNQAAYLEDEGFTVLTTEGGATALDMLARQPRPDIAVLDIRLAGMDGEEFVLRAHKILPTLRFLIHTGSSDYVVPRTLSEIGITAQNVVPKPVADLRLLRQVIDRLLMKRGRDDEG